MAEAARAELATNGNKRTPRRQPPMLTPLPDRPQNAPARPAGISCPTCQSHASVDKVSHVVRTGRGRLFWENGEVAHYETELSGLLDAPARPKQTPILSALLGLLPPLAILGAILLLTSFLQAQDYVTIDSNHLSLARQIALGWFGVVVPLVLVARYVKNRLDVRKKLPVWRVAHRRWTGLYYCSHDDIVFTPHANLVASPWEIDKLLYVAGGPEPRARRGVAWVRNLSFAGVLLVVAGASYGTLSSPAPEAESVSPSRQPARAAPATGADTPPAQTQQQQPVEVVSNRADCATIRGTTYLSPEERAWYLGNCVQ